MSDSEYEVEDHDTENQHQENADPEEEEEEPSSSGRGQSSSVPSLRGAPEHEREDIIRRQNAEVRYTFYSYSTNSISLPLTF